MVEAPTTSPSRLGERSPEKKTTDDYRLGAVGGPAVGCERLLFVTRSVTTVGGRQGWATSCLKRGSCRIVSNHGSNRSDAADTLLGMFSSCRRLARASLFAPANVSASAISSRLVAPRR